MYQYFKDLEMRLSKLYTICQQRVYGQGTNNPILATEGMVERLTADELRILADGMDSLRTLPITPTGQAIFDAAGTHRDASGQGVAETATMAEPTLVKDAGEASGDAGEGANSIVGPHINPTTHVRVTDREPLRKGDEFWHKNLNRWMHYSEDQWGYKLIDSTMIVRRKRIPAEAPEELDRAISEALQSGATIGQISQAIRRSIEPTEPTEPKECYVRLWVTSRVLSEGNDWPIRCTPATQTEFGSWKEIKTDSTGFFVEE